MPLFVPSAIRRISSVVGHPYYREDFAKYRIAVDGVPLEYAVTADCDNGYAHKLALTPIGAVATEIKYGKPRAKVVRVKGLVQIFTESETA